MSELCDDWSCPSLWSCRYALGRSEGYWRMDDESELRRRRRLPTQDSCDEYEQDEVKPCLM